MALWGKKDDVFSGGTISINYATKAMTGAGTTFTNLSVGDVILVGAGATLGRATIASITDNTNCSIASTEFLSGAAISGVAWEASQEPKYVLFDSHYSATQVRGADENEVASTKTTIGLAHAGWVGIKTYIDSSGRLRTKSEVLVAMSGISTGTASGNLGGDSDDDPVLPDSVIVISDQPQNAVGVATTTLTFSVTAAASPVAASLSYQWQFSSTGVAYTNLSDGAVYSGTTTAGLAVTATNTALNGFKYRVRISATGITTAFSDAATLTVS
jgi:hypothetical protein